MNFWYQDSWYINKFSPILVYDKWDPWGAKYLCKNIYTILNSFCRVHHTHHDGANRIIVQLTILRSMICRNIGVSKYGWVSKFLIDRSYKVVTCTYETCMHRIHVQVNMASMYTYTGDLMDGVTCATSCASVIRQAGRTICMRTYIRANALPVEIEYSDQFKTSRIPHRRTSAYSARRTYRTWTNVMDDA